jgi:hypothetical protein
MVKDLVDTEYSGEQECSPSLRANRDWIGVRKARFRASLPSEPDWQFSRIRLSGRWFTVKRDR